MKNLSYIFSLIILLVFSIGSFVLGRLSVVQSDTKQETITKEIILEEIQSQYFVVTKTLFLDEDINITVSEGSEWKDFLWGKEISASGIVRIDVGVDLGKLTVDNIVVDKLNKEVTIEMPEASILDSSIFGDIEFETEKGIIKNISDLIQDDESADYNNAVAELIIAGEKTAGENSELMVEAENDTKSMIGLIVGNLGFKLK